jgi:putative acetyltransferase
VVHIALPPIRPILEPPHGVTLRAPCSDDVEAITLMSNLPRYRWGTMRMPFQSTAETQAFLERINTGSDRHVAAVLDGRVIGMAGLTRLNGRRIHVADLGIGIHDDFQGRGIGRALMAALIDIADNWWNITRLQLGVYADNLPAIRLYEKFNFVLEGVERKSAFRDGVFMDVNRMGRLSL